MNDETRNIKGLYVHVPFCAGKCFYCAFYSRPYESDLIRRYLRALEIELTRLGGLKEYPRLNAETIYFGGGTPSLLSLPELDILCSLIKNNISFVALREWTVECNPRSLTAEKLALFTTAGVNRISLGAQSFDNSVLKWLGRRHSVVDIYEAVRMIKSAGLHNFGIDLIACIPGFNGAAWEKTLISAVKLKPAHISVYALTDEEGSLLAPAMAGRPRESGQLLTANPHSVPLCHSREDGNPDSDFPNPGFPLKAGMTFRDDKCKIKIPKLLTEDEELAALNLAESILTREGFQRYEISNYARPGFECLHNLSCWRGEEYIGLGPSAASHVGLKRWTNLPDLEEYLGAIEQGAEPPRMVDLRDEKLKQIEKVVFSLRMAEGISEASGKICEQTLRSMSGQGLVLNAEGCWRLTERGMNLADYVGAELLTGAS